MTGCLLCKVTIFLFGVSGLSFLQVIPNACEESRTIVIPSVSEESPTKYLFF